MTGSLEQIAQHIRENQEFIILTHINPDGDALGSAFGLKRALLALGKQAEVVLDAPVGGPLAGFDWGGAVYTEEMEPPKAVIGVDNSDVARFGRCRGLFEGAKLSLCVDHHITDSIEAHAKFVDEHSASTGEIVYRLTRLLDAPLDQGAAQALYIAVLTDTGMFRYSSATPDTMRIVAALMEHGFDHADVVRRIYDNIPIDRLRLQAEAIGRIELFHEGKISVITMPLALMKQYHATEDDIDGFVNLARSVEGVEVCAMLKEREKEIKISLRSNEYANVAEVASRLGGGGHIRASGCSVQTGLDEAKRLIVEELAKSL